MSVDPGLDGTGFALWVGGELRGSAVIPNFPLENWWEKANAIAVQVAMEARTWGAHYAVVEQGKIYPKSVPDSITKLLVSTGIIMGKLPCTFHPLAVGDWKGNTPKAIIFKRIEHKLPKWRWTTKTSHEKDAVGLGLAFLGIL